MIDRVDSNEDYLKNTSITEGLHYEFGVSQTFQLFQVIEDYKKKQIQKITKKAVCMQKIFILSWDNLIILFDYYFTLINLNFIII